MTTKQQKYQVAINGEKFALTNADLSKELTTMVDAMQSLKSNTWKYAQAVTNIVNHELYKDDFKTRKAFTDSIGLKESLCSKYVKACDFRHVSVHTYIMNLKLDNPNINEDEVINGFSVNKCYYLQVLVENNLFVEFLDFIGEDAEKLHLISERKLEELLKAFKNKDKEEEQQEPSDVVEEATTEETQVNDNVELWFQDEKYIIPRKVLDSYKVTDGVKA